MRTINILIMKGMILMSDGSITKRKDGRYELRISEGKDISGKLIRKSFYGHSKKEVKQKYDEYKEKQLTNQLIAKDITFKEWAYKWLASYKKDKVREYTYINTYLRPVEKYLVPFFGNTNLKNIKQIHIQQFFNSHSDLAVATLKKFKVSLNDIFEKAIDNDLCYKNPVKGVTLNSEKIKQEKRVYTKEQQNKAINWCLEHDIIDMLILLKTGLRRGELLGLRWSDIDFNNKTISVKQSVTPKAQIGSEIDLKVKSESSMRTIPIDDLLATFLIQHKSDGYVMCEIAPHNYSKFFKRNMDKMSSECGIPVLTPHELRHTYGTLLRENGVDIYTIQKVMGHSDIKVTADIYVHNDIEVLRKAMKI